jgi:hypothetical protein
MILQPIHHRNKLEVSNLFPDTECNFLLFTRVSGIVTQMGHTKSQS